MSDNDRIRVGCKECANLIMTPLGARCRYEWNLLSNPKQVCARGERFKPKEGKE